MFTSTCKTLYENRDRILLDRMKPVAIKGRERCTECGIYVFIHRYEEHVNNCRNRLERMKIKYNQVKCSECNSLHCKPQLLASNNNKKMHPTILCIWCGQGITRMSTGCFECMQFQCEIIECKHCNDNHPKCERPYKCVVMRLMRRLRDSSVFLGTPYESSTVCGIYIRDITGTTQQPVVSAVSNGFFRNIWWILVDSNTYKHLNDNEYVNDGKTWKYPCDKVFIVDKHYYKKEGEGILNIINPP